MERPQWLDVDRLPAARAVDAIETALRGGLDPEANLPRVRAAGLAAAAGSPHDVSDADLVVCATTATTPLFEGRLPPPSACVVAVGSHQ